MVFGGSPRGLYSLVLVVLLALFITGLMVGRTPEYVGKKIGPREMQLIMIYLLLRARGCARAECDRVG